MDPRRLDDLYFTMLTRSFNSYSGALVSCQQELISGVHFVLQCPTVGEAVEASSACLFADLRVASPGPRLNLAPAEAYRFVIGDDMIFRTPGAAPCCAIQPNVERGP